MGFGDNDHTIRELIKCIKMISRKLIFEDVIRNGGAHNYKIVKSCTTLSISYCYQHTQIIKLSDQGGKIMTIQAISYFSQKHWWIAGPYVEVAYFPSEVV